ncbi:MAG: FxsA family protein, partial [Gemmatimonadota bacterium]
ALLFIVVPLVELALLIRLGQWMGFWPTMGLVLLTGAVGAWLARAEGFRTVWQLRSDLEQGRIPHQAMQDGVAILVGGVLLLTPGFLTDAAGFSLLFPPTRRWVQRRFRRRIEDGIRKGHTEGRIRAGVFRTGPTSDEWDDVQEAEWTRVDELGRPPDEDTP